MNDWWWQADKRASEYVRETLRGEEPVQFHWVQKLTRPHLIQFVVEIKDAIDRWAVSDDRTELLEIIDAWEATAAVDADPEMSAHLLRPIEETEYVDWHV